MLEAPSRGELHLMQRERLANRHAHDMDNIIKENAHKDKYWILGKVKTSRKNGRTTIRPLIKAYDVQPDLIKEAYLYEIDNVNGKQTLLWVMHPNNKLSLPTTGKTISVAG